MSTLVLCASDRQTTIGEIVDVLWKGEGEADYRGDLAVFSYAEDDLAVMDGNK